MAQATTRRGGPPAERISQPSSKSDAEAADVTSLGLRQLW